MTIDQSPTALERLIREGSEDDLRRFLLLLQPQEIADIIEVLESAEDRARAFRAIVGQKRSSVLRNIEEGEERDELIEALEPAETARLVTEMKSDDAADLLLELDEAEKAEVLRHVPRAEREELQRLTAYSEDSAGGIMQTELVKVRSDQSVRAAVEEIRRTRDHVGELHEIFVIDAEGRLMGWVKERALILAADDDRISTITRPVPQSVPVTMDQEDIADLVRDYDLSSVPVIDENERLLGRILVDDIVDVVTEEATEDITRLGGTDPEEIYEPSVRQALRSRTPWLVIAFFGTVTASLVIAAAEDVLHSAGSLLAFLPVIMGMGGGSSNQAATVTVRSLALGRIRPGQVMAVIRKEAVTGLLVALGTGIVLWLVVRVTNTDQPYTALIAALSVFGTICIGTTLGVAVPLVLEKLGADPAVATSPFVSTMNDVLGATIIIVVGLMVL
jgi:magnesium transporter